MPSPAMVVACVALIAALGGSAYAALSKNSVKSRQIAKSAVKSSEIATGAVKAAEIKSGAVGPDAIAEGAVGGAALDDGSVGSGDLAPLSVKLANLGVVVNTRYTDVDLPDDGSKVTALATCPAGQVIAGGGYSFGKPASAPPIGADEFTEDFNVIQSRPSVEPPNPGTFPAQGSGFNGWRVTAVNEAGGPTGADAQITSMAVCLRDR